MTLRFKLGVVGVLAALSFGGYAGAPSLARWYVNRRPDLKVGRVEILNLHSAILHDVTVTKPGLEGHLVTVTVDKEAHTVTIDGGNLQFSEAEAKKAEGGSEGFTVTAKNLELVFARDGATVMLQDSTVDDKQVCFKTALVAHPKAGGSLDEGCVSRDKNHVTFKSGLISSLAFDGFELEDHIFIHDGDIQRNGSDGTFSATEILSGDRKVTGVKVLKEGKRVEAEAVTASFTYARVSPDPLTLNKVKVWVPDLTKVMTSTIETEVNGIPIHVDTSLRRVWASATCQSWLESLPNEMREGPLQEVRFKGDLSFDIALKPEVKLSFKESCKTEGVPSFIKVLRGEFKYVVYDAKKNEVIRSTGPKSKEWVALRDVSENMALALTTTEDPAFFSHHGFIPGAIENSLRDNLKAGKFIRGGSTITMQLAKNLWLRRSKTLGRKVQEAFLTMALESNLTKAEILALYLNAVEFGPDIYGIGDASKQLLGTEPSRLSLTEAIYLAQRLPNPVKAGPLNDSKRAAIKRVLDLMVVTNKITSEVAAGEENAVYFDTTAANLVVNQ